MSLPGNGDSTRIVAAADLSNVKKHALNTRYGNFEVQFNGLTIYCHDLLSFYMAAKDIFLHKIYNFIPTSHSPKIIDGGGHIGLFTLYVKSQLPGARVVIFEPDPFSLGLLKKNLAANNIENVTIVEAGLFDEDKTVSFSPDGSDGSSITDEDSGKVSIPVQRLSPFLDEPIDFIKLNIEGAELEVIREISEQLTLVNEIVIEYHGFPEIGQRLHEILAVLDSAGFRYMIHDFDAETNGASKPPFSIEKDTRFFLLIYGRRLLEKKETTVHIVEEPQRVISDLEEIDTVEFEEEDLYSHELKRIEPICRKFGFSRGSPIDRFYIESFLHHHRGCITGTVLEIGDNTYTKQYGINVISSDVLNTVEGPGTTVVADLSEIGSIPENHYDCIILTQTLQFLYDYKNALKNIYRSLKPGGSLLVTASGISQISRFDYDRWGEYWRFTDKSLALALSEVNKSAQVQVFSHGNLAAAKAFLDGRAVEEIEESVLNVPDIDYQLVLTGVMTKSAATSEDFRHSKAPEKSQIDPTILLYHRVIDDPIDAQLLSVSPKYFEQQLQFLKENCRVLALEEMLEEFEKGKCEPNTVSLTFDDGYFDNYEYALPLLEKYRVPATFFISTNYIGSNREFWWDALERIILLSPLPQETLELDLGDGNTTKLRLGTAAERLASYDQLCQMVIRDHPDEIHTFISQLYQWAGIKFEARPEYRAMTLSELQKLAQSPIAHIGAHTANHAFLGTQTPEQQYEELNQSKQNLEYHLSTKIDHVSYPWGSEESFNGTTIQIAQELGFKAGIANIQGELSSSVDLFRIPRRLVRNWGTEDFQSWLMKDEKQLWEQSTFQERNSHLKDITKRLQA